MAQQTIEILRNYMTCEDPAVKNKYFNLLDSFWHKSEGQVLESINEDDNGITFTFTNQMQVTIPKPEQLGSVEISFVNGLQAALDNKVDKQLGKGLSTNDFTNDFLQKLQGLENYTLPESFPISQIANLQDTLDNLVVKEEGKGLSENDFTDALKQQLQDLNAGVQFDVDSPQTFDRFWLGTQAEYEALPEQDPTTEYIIKEEIYDTLKIKDANGNTYAIQLNATNDGFNFTNI